MCTVTVTNLIHDLKALVSGLNTEVTCGTLSGGQRKRIHLSRTLYQERDIYLLDNPLASLDGKVASEMA